MVTSQEQKRYWITRIKDTIERCKIQDVIIDPEFFIREIMRNAQISKRSAKEYLEEAELTLREPVNAGNDERTGN